MLSSVWTFVRSLFESKIYEVRHCCDATQRVFVRRMGFMTYLLDPTFTAVWERHLTPTEVLAGVKPAEFRLGAETHIGFIAQDLGLIAPIFDTTSDPRSMTIPYSFLERTAREAGIDLTGIEDVPDYDRANWLLAKLNAFNAVRNAVLSAQLPQLTEADRREAEQEGRLVPSSCKADPGTQLAMHIEERNRRYMALPLHLRPDLHLM